MRFVIKVIKSVLITGFVERKVTRYGALPSIKSLVGDHNPVTDAFRCRREKLSAFSRENMHVTHFVKKKKNSCDFSATGFVYTVIKYLPLSTVLLCYYFCLGACH